MNRRGFLTLSGEVIATSAGSSFAQIPGHLIDLPDEPPAQSSHLGSSGIDPTALSNPDFGLWLCLHLPESRLANTFDDDWTAVTIYTATHRATITFPPKDSGEYCTVVQDQRRLADTVEAAFTAWQPAGRPGRERLGITATAAGQRAWLDAPDSGLSWPLPS